MLGREVLFNMTTKINYFVDTFYGKWMTNYYIFIKIKIKSWGIVVL